jgi:hypothetical protein
LTNERDPVVLDGFSPDYEGMSDECKLTGPLASGLADEIAIKVDRNFGYAVFVSYAEVYNEKVCPKSLACNALMTDIRSTGKCTPHHTSWKEQWFTPLVLPTRLPWGFLLLDEPCCYGQWRWRCVETETFGTEERP